MRGAGVGGDLIWYQLAPPSVVVTSGGVGVKKEINKSATAEKDKKDGRRTVDGQPSDTNCRPWPSVKNCSIRKYEKAGNQED